MLFSDSWTDFELLYAGDGEKYERWGRFFLQRPDPQAIWARSAPGQDPGWPEPHGIYHRSGSGGGFWEKKKKFPEKWEISYPCAGGKLTFRIEPMGFKHTGLFPEQAVNWDFCARKIREASGKIDKIRILNLFAYTGGATLACAAAGAAEVVHVDASKGMIARARENVELSDLKDRYIRFIAEDCNRFVERELRRGRKYHGIIMDPPAYGRGTAGELWKLEESLYPLVEKCSGLLEENALFFLLNSYTTGLSASVLDSILRLAISSRFEGLVSAHELGFHATKMDVLLPCGAVGRWES